MMVGIFCLSDETESLTKLIKPNVIIELSPPHICAFVLPKYNEPSFSHSISARSRERERSFLPQHFPFVLTRRGSSFRWKVKSGLTHVGMGTYLPKGSDF